MFNNLAAKAARIIAIIVISIVLLNIILFITFSIPAVQRGVANAVLEKMMPLLDTKADLKGIRIRLFNTVQLEGLYLEDRQQDTLLYVDKLAVRIDALDILKSRITVRKAGLENFAVNVYRPSTDEPFNFQFIIDAFTKKGKKEKKEKKSWRITADEVILKNGAARYDILSEPRTPGLFNARHISLEKLNFKGKVDFSSIDRMTAEVLHMGFQEANSGLCLSALKADIEGKGAWLRIGGLTISLNGSRFNLKEAAYNLETKAFTLNAKSDLIAPSDLNLFVPRFAHLNKPLSFEILAEGTLPEVIVKQLDFRYGPETGLFFTGRIEDYSKIDGGEVALNVRELYVSPEDMEALIRIGTSSFSSPPSLKALGNLSLHLEADGKLKRFHYDGRLHSSQGDITLTGTGSILNNFKRLLFEGPVEAKEIQLDKILGEKVGAGVTSLKSDLSLEVMQGKGIVVDGKGNISSTSYKGYPYHDIYFDGSYSGQEVTAELRTDTKTNRFHLSGHATLGKEMALALKGELDRLDLRPFVIVKDWKDPYLKMSIDGSLSGSSVDDLKGEVLIDNIALADSNFYYNPGTLYLQATVDESQQKKIAFFSSFLEGELVGDYHFSTIAPELMRAVQPHLPSLIKEKPRQSGPANSAGNHFNFNLRLQNTEDISYALSLPFYNVEPATISGGVDVNADEVLRIEAHLPRLMAGNMDIRETKLELYDRSSGLRLDLNSYLVQDNGFVNLKLNSYAAADSLNNQIDFSMKQNESHADGLLRIAAGFFKNREEQPAANIRILPAIITFNNTRIDLNDAIIGYAKDRISITNFGISENDVLLLGIDGVASKSEADNIRIYFNNTELANLLNPFNVNNFTGSINGDIYVRQALDNPMIRTERLRVENITVQGDTIGTLRVEGNWDNLLSGLDLKAWLEDGQERSLDVRGFIPTGDKSPFPMNVDLTISDFKLKAIHPLTAGIFSELAGKINSKINLSGTLSQPVTEGWIGIDNGMMKVAFTNVAYTVSDTIEIRKDNVGMKNLVIRDENNHTAILDVNLSHTNFGRMVYNASLRLNDFMLLNNRDRTDLMAYGNLKLSGDLQVTGSPSGVFGKGNLTSSSRSDVTIVLPQTASATEYSGIVYVSGKPKESDSLAFLRKNPSSVTNLTSNVPSGIPIVMALKVNLTPQLDAGVVLDPTTGNALEVNGEGELMVNFNSKSTPPVLLYGDYVFNSGKFHYNLQNLRTIEFNIREGSRLSMEGNPMNTQFNLTAYLPVRADLSTLSQTFSAELANTRVPVNALLKVSGNLQAMDLQYDIELPESSNDIQQRVKSFIPNEESKILQFAYLVASGSFIPSEGSPDMEFGSSMFTKYAASYLSRGLDVLFANALRDNWTVSTNLESVDGTLDNVRMGVDVSTRLMNDRLRINTNLSYGDKSLLAGQQAFMGEFELEYDINNWLMLRAFNRANQRFDRRAPTTQGVGVMVTREAKRLKELFDFRLQRKKEEEKSEKKTE